MLKLANESHSLEDIKLQIDILTELQSMAFPTNYAYPLVGGNGYIGGSAPKLAMVLDFVDGLAGDKVVAAQAHNQTNICAVMRSLGEALAQLHQSNLAEA